MTLRSVFLAALLLLAGTAQAADVTAGSLTISHAWARAAMNGANGAAYVTVTNAGTEGDRLVAAASPVAAKVELHVHLMEDGVMKMRPVDGIDIGPGAAVEFHPGGYHVMLLGLTGPLTAGTSFPMTLTFAKAGAVAVTVEVKGMGMDGEHDHHH